MTKRLHRRQFQRMGQRMHSNFRNWGSGKAYLQRKLKHHTDCFCCRNLPQHCSPLSICSMHNLPKSLHWHQKYFNLFFPSSWFPQLFSLNFLSCRQLTARKGSTWSIFHSLPVWFCNLRKPIGRLHFVRKVQLRRCPNFVQEQSRSSFWCKRLLCWC